MAIERFFDTVTKVKLAEFEIQYDNSKNRVSGYDVRIGNIEKSTDFIYGETNKGTRHHHWCQTERDTHLFLRI